MPSLNPMCAPWLDKGYTMVMCGNDGMGFAKLLRDNLVEGHKQLDAWKEKQKTGANA